jgi:hypothetical protein
MAFIFQSNPEHWNLRKNLIPGNEALWSVSRYQSLMYPGALVLLWEAKGRREEKYKGFYGWGVTTELPKEDQFGKLRIRIIYIVRWIVKSDAEIDPEETVAPIPANTVWTLDKWRGHPLQVMPVGTNFLATPEQIQELDMKVVAPKFQDSQFEIATNLETKGKRIDWTIFTPFPKVEVRNDKQ